MPPMAGRQPVKQFAKISGQRRTELHRLTRYRVDEPEFGSMEGHSTGSGPILGLNFGGSRIDPLATYWVTALGKMNSDLMGPTGF